jgi:hypothetical protein
MPCTFTDQQIGLHFQIRKHALQQVFVILHALRLPDLRCIHPATLRAPLKEHAMLKAHFGNRHVTFC